MLIFFWNQPGEEAVARVSQWPLSRHHPICQPGIRFMLGLLPRLPILRSAN